jgi:hypothetical protein
MLRYTYSACLVKHWFLLEKSVLVYATVWLAVLTIFAHAYEFIIFAVCLINVHTIFIAYIMLTHEILTGCKMYPGLVFASAVIGGTK